MKFRIGDREFDRPCLWEEDGSTVIIDQRFLPFSVVLSRMRGIGEMVNAIKTLAVRGAPSIGAFGAYSLSQCISKGEDPERCHRDLITSRPTAVDLGNALDRVMEGYREGGVDGAVGSADSFAGEVVESCRRIGESGKKLISRGTRIMTHCNAGALATLDWGTAVAPIRMAVREGNTPFVWVSETRPLFQGSRLTAWELSQEGIPHRIIVDSASGYVMRSGEVDMIVVGADRVCANGDLANKIGTYGKAVVARELGIPFYVAIPWSTLDPKTSEGDLIPIETRCGGEVESCMGKPMSNPRSASFNPAFDVTPSEYVTGYITPDGILDVHDLREKMRSLMQ
jgi:S-methyl-5-thioribose-1-phosphate isomerase